MLSIKHALEVHVYRNLQCSINVVINKVRPPYANELSDQGIILRLKGVNASIRVCILWELGLLNLNRPGPRGYKTFSCSTQLSIDIQKLIKSNMLKNKGFSCIRMLRCCFYHANKYWNANNCWHFNIYEQDKFRAQLSWVWKSVITSGPGLFKQAWLLSL